MDFPTVQEFKDFFTRDFPYGNTKEFVMDSDIERAQKEAKMSFNGALFDTQDNFSMMFNYLTAHFLVNDLNASSQGISGSYAWATGSKSVGSVSVSQSIPSAILADPFLAMISKTNYGAKYLLLLLPFMRGNFGYVCGRTLP